MMRFSLLNLGPAPGASPLGPVLTLLLACLAAPALAQSAAPAAAENGTRMPADAGAAPAAATPRPGPRELVIATRHVPPFAIRGAEGSWTGITIELWDRIAGRLGVPFRYQDMGLAEMLDAVAEGRADAAAAALTITAEREGRVDFSHPYLTSGLGIAVPQRPGGGMAAVLKRLFSGRFLGVLAALLALLTAVGALVWLVERRRNAQFQGAAAKGIGSGLWWSAVTMTTVGYGDKAPVTPLGRGIALVWMFAGIIMISGFTAAMTTALTVGELASPIRGLNDLYDARVLTVRGSTSERFLAEHGVRHEALTSLPKALARLADNGADAVVYDAPILRWMIAEQHAGVLRVLPQVLERQDYGIALPQQSPARERINTLLLEIVASDDWEALVQRYLGKPQ